MKLTRPIDFKRCSLLELCVGMAGGYIKGAKVAAFVTAWGVCRRELGHSPTVEEYAEWWGQSARNAYYEQSRFRAAFRGQLDTPDPLLDLMERQGVEATGRADYRSELQGAAFA